MSRATDHEMFDAGLIVGDYIDPHSTIPEEHWEQIVADAELGNDPSEQSGLELIDWHSLNDMEDPIVMGIAHPGRWTALASKAKQGKTALLVNVTLWIAQGLDPFDRTRQEPVTTLYIDAEVGALELVDRIADNQLDVDQLGPWHATDNPTIMDTLEGGERVLNVATALGAAVVVIDGINGVVNGKENDDTTWRDLYRYTIAPLKRAGIAVVTGDNLGKSENGPRGSSVKMDKADAIVELHRTDVGLKLTTTHRRNRTYPKEWFLSVEGLADDDARAVRYRHTATTWPEGSERVADLLDRLDVPLDWGKKKAREAIKAAGETAARDTVLNAAIRYRRTQELTGRHPSKNAGTTPGTTFREPPSGTTFSETPENRHLPGWEPPPGTSGNHPKNHSGTRGG